jgi:hypothetical protein
MNSRTRQSLAQYPAARYSGLLVPESCRTALLSPTLCENKPALLSRSLEASHRESQCGFFLHTRTTYMRNELIHSIPLLEQIDLLDRAFNANKHEKLAVAD